MSWFARSLASSFRATDEEHDDEEDKEEEEDDEEESRRHGRGMKEDLSELTKSFTKQIWGVASFLAPPPTTSTQDADSSLRDSPASVSNPDPYSSSEGNSQQVESLNRIENSSSGSLTENAQGLTGIRSDLAEIRGSVKTGLSKFSSNKAVHGISKLASTFFPFKGESEGEEFREAESGDFEEEEEESGAFEEEGESGAFEEEESFKSAVGITDEVLTFARNISMHPETWLDFPLFDDEDDTDEDETEPTPKENNQRTTEAETKEQEMQEPSNTAPTSLDQEAPESGGHKRHHNSDTSDSDKDNGATIAENQLALITTSPSPGPWQKVEKKKGRKV